MKERKHLRRLGMVYQSQPRYFITACTFRRCKRLNHHSVHQLLREHWAKSMTLYGWAIGSYVVMPDHVHFFCVDVESRTSLSKMVGAWKQWSAKAICPLLEVGPPLWQPEFFDHLLRSHESYSEKWEYVRQNPVRAGFVVHPEEWPFSGHIDYV